MRILSGADPEIRVGGGDATSYEAGRLGPQLGPGRSPGGGPGGEAPGSSRVIEICRA